MFASTAGGLILLLAVPLACIAMFLVGFAIGFKVALYIITKASSPTT